MRKEPKTEKNEGIHFLVSRESGESMIQDLAGLQDENSEKSLILRGLKEDIDNNETGNRRTS